MALPIDRVKQLKSKMTLDFNGSKFSVKGNPISSLNGNSGHISHVSLKTPVLGSVGIATPDLNMLKLASPELERMLFSASGIGTPTQIFFPKNVTEAQEAYARGFIDALNELHNKSGISPQETITTDNIDEQFTVNNSLCINALGAPLTISNVARQGQYVFTTVTPLPGTLIPGVPGFVKLMPVELATTPLRMIPPSENVTSQPLHIVPISEESLRQYASPNGRRLVDVNENQQLQRSTALRRNAERIMADERPPPPDLKKFHRDDLQLPNVVALSKRSNREVDLSDNDEDSYQTTQDSRSGDSSPMPPSSGRNNEGGTINMEVQELKKHERKKERNRVAARKCRERKLQKISHLEEKLRELKGDHDSLTRAALAVKEQVSLLKRQVTDHVKNGCEIMLMQDVCAAEQAAR